MVKTLNTVDGGVVTGYQEAFDLVVALCEAAGFLVASVSSQSRSTYLNRPGNDRVIRASDHSNHHPGRNAEVIEVRLTGAREEIVTVWVDDVEGEIEERDFINVIRESPAEIESLIKAAIAEYDR